MQILIEQIVSKLGIPGDSICKKYGKLPGYTGLDLVNAIVTTDSLKEAGVLLGGYSSDALRLKLKSIGVNKSISNERFITFMLKSIDMRKCAGCKLVLPISKYYKVYKDQEELSTLCKACAAKSCSNYTKNNPEVIASYRELNSKKYSMYASNRRARQLKATPKWANLQEIEKIYLECPTGFQVDHIIPLQGQIVCGLHVASNLQYLTPKDNAMKSNSFESEKMNEVVS